MSEFKLVPVSPTAEMKDAVRAKGGNLAVAFGLAAWSDMLAAAPAAIDTAPTPSPDQIRREALNQAASDVLAERQRQVEQEGWAPEHDDQHNPGTLSGAGSAYALNASYLLNPYHGTPLDDPPDSWLWDREWWKPNMGDNPRRDLVKAGALILAEIERLDRESGAPPAAAPTPSPDQIRREAARSLLTDFEASKLPEHAIDAAHDMHCEGERGNSSDIIEAFLRALITGGDGGSP